MKKIYFANIYILPMPILAVLLILRAGGGRGYTNGAGPIFNCHPKYLQVTQKLLNYSLISTNFDKFPEIRVEVFYGGLGPVAGNKSRSLLKMSLQQEDSNRCTDI